MRVNPAANICKTFTSFGYCRAGALCTSRHIFECPDYSSSGCCRKENCRLPHIDRAGQLRLLGNPTVDGKLQDEANDVSSDEEIELEGREDDVDSDDLQEEVLLGADEDGNNALLQDFVHL